MIEPFVNFSGFQKRGRLPARHIVQNVYLEKVAERLVKLVLMKISLTTHQHRLGRKVALLACIDHGFKRGACVFQSTGTEQRLPTRVIELGN